MQNILIPTDFTIGSLKLVKHVLDTTTSDEIRLVFVCGVYLPSSITEMLFYSPEKTLLECMNTEFTDGLEIIRSKYQSRINKVQIEIFYGTTNAAFSNFLEAHKIDCIFMPADYRFKVFHNRSFDCIPYLQKAKVPVQSIGWVEKTGLPEKDLLAELFLT
ncbi:MAG TPA: hypothetical protein VK177_11370 [Flavobacteriales bacterium]|nr:hypothetical protein [Flavobacteriales bacterium]